MPVFRRSSAGATDGTAQDSRGAPGPGATANETVKDRPAAQAKKGRPTPKRSEAERNRYQPITGTKSGGSRSGTTSRPAGPRTAEDKSRDRSERARRMDAMKRGEEWALGPRDRGPARKLARDYVDAHRRPSEFYMYVLILLLVALLSRNKALNSGVSYLVIAMIAVIIVDGLLIRRALGKLVAQRLPGESTRGLTMYAVMRALQIRRWRMPAPRLKPGDKV
jgi:hypothetical protein